MRTTITLGLLFTLFFSCSKSESKKCLEFEGDCSRVRCIAHWDYFYFKLFDKTSGADLIFGANPRYTPNDIMLYFDAARTITLPITIDTPNKRLYTRVAEEEMYLSVKNTDVYKLTAEFRGLSCCSAGVENLWMDGQSVCTCCSYEAIGLSIK